MPTATGTILLVQESRIRLLAEDGRGMVLVLSHDAPIEPQDLPPLTGRRVRLRYRPSPRLVAGIVDDLQPLDAKEIRS